MLSPAMYLGAFCIHLYFSKRAQPKQVHSNDKSGLRGRGRVPGPKYFHQQCSAGPEMRGIIYLQG